MSVSPTTASGALAKTLASTGAAPAGPVAGDASFASLLRNSIEGAIDANRASEKATVQAVAGESDLTRVVAAVTNAELTLEAVVAVRDRVIAAYQDIVRMPI